MFDLADLASYPHFEIYPPVMQAHGILLSKHPMLVNACIPSPNESVGEAGTSSPIPFLRRARKTHTELHEEVFTPVNVCVEQPSSKPPGEIKARRTYSSRMTNAHPALPRTASAVPPVPPLPVSRSSSLRSTPSPNAEARHSGSYTPPSQPKDQPTSSHCMKITHPFSMRSDQSIAPSNSVTSLGSSSRRDGHSKQGFRPRDSLVLEKARHFDHLTLRNDFTLW